MAQQSKEQKETVGRVMHEFKHGELETGTGKKVKNPKQAVAIALHEAGASKYESDEENKKNLRKTRQRERRGETSQDEAEQGGKARSSRSSGGSSGGSEKSKAELYEEARQRDVPGRSKMSKEELARALHEK